MENEKINADDYLFDLEEINNIHKGLSNLLIRLIDEVNLLNRKLLK